AEYAPAVSHRHERIDLSWRSARAQLPLSLLRAQLEPRTAAGSADAHLQIFDYLSDAAVRGVDRRSLFFVQGVADDGALCAPDRRLGRRGQHDGPQGGHGGGQDDRDWN